MAKDLANNSFLLKKHYIISLILSCLILFLVYSQGQAASVQGKIEVSQGGKIAVELSFKNSSPKAAILTLMLPKGSRVKSAKPALSSFNEASGQARWLLKEPGKGPVRLQMSIEAPSELHAGSVKGVLTYIDPYSGSSERVELPVASK